MKDPEYTQDQEAEKDIARLLEAAGPREELPEDLRQRWEEHFRSELAPAIQERKRGWGLPLAALAASIVALVITLDLLTTDPAGQLPMQVQAVAGSAEVVTGQHRELAAVPGQNLRSGVSLLTNNNSRVALDWGGYDLRLNGNSRVTLYGDRVELEAGEVYVSNSGRRRSIREIVIVTPFATIRDIGTQFKVRLADDRVISSVRQGSIVVSTRHGEHRADASAQQAWQLSVAQDNNVESVEDESDWGWIYPVANNFNIEGRTVYEFLRWSTGESGRELVFASEDVEIAARTRRFPGPTDISSYDPESAVPIVLLSTRFRAEPREGNILWVNRRSE